MAGPGGLAAWLRGLDDDVLSRLCTSRSDLLHPLPADFDALAARMCSPGSLAAALDPLDRWTLHVLEAVMVIGDGVAPAELVEVLQVPTRRVTAAVDLLMTAGLVWPPGPLHAARDDAPATRHRRTLQHDAPATGHPDPPEDDLPAGRRPAPAEDDTPAAPPADPPGDDAAIAGRHESVEVEQPAERERELMVSPGWPAAPVGLSAPTSLREVIRYPCGLGPSIRPGRQARRADPWHHPAPSAGPDRPARPWWSPYPLEEPFRRRLTAALGDASPAETDLLRRLSAGNPVGVVSGRRTSPPDPTGPQLASPGSGSGPGATREVPAPSAPDAAVATGVSGALAGDGAGGGVGAAGGGGSGGGGEDQGRGPGPQDRIDRLVDAGLLLAQGDGTVVLPGEVALLLRGNRPMGQVEPDPPVVATRRVAGSGRPWDSVGGDAAGTVVRLAEALLELLAQAPAAQLRSGGLGVRELRRIATDLRLDQATTVLVLETVHAAGLLSATHDHASVWLPSPSLDTWLTRATPARWAELAAAWLTMPRAPGAIGLRDDRDRAASALGPDLAWWPAARFRRHVLTALAGLAEGHTVATDDLRELLAWHHPAQATLFASLRLDDVLMEGEALGVLGRGAMTTAGRALVAGSTERSIPPAAAAAAADAVAGHLPEPVDHVLLQADLTAVAPGPLTAEVSRELSLLADIESSGAASVYRFSPATVRRGLDAGRTTTEIMTFLRTTSRTPVPQTLDYLVADIGRRHGRMRVGAGQAFVRSEDEQLLAEVLASRRAHALRLRALAPTVLVAQAPVNQVLDVLRRAGYAPAADGPAGAAVHARTGRRGPAAAPRVQPWVPPALTGKPLATALRALHAADRLHQARDGGQRIHGQDSILQALGRAAQAGRPLWISYVNADGVASRRMVEPLEVSGGLLEAFDHMRGARRTFAVHRIAAVGTVGWDDDEV